MDKAYADSDFIIARSGSSILEIAACGRPSILIPYPYAAENHQKHNANVLLSKQASFVMNGKHVDRDHFFEQFEKMLLENDLLSKMSEAALSLRKEAATEKIVNFLREAA